MSLPVDIKWLFWDCDFDLIDLSTHRNFIIHRILESGDWKAIVWLRNSVGDVAIREWLLAKNGGGLDPRRLRFWGLILHIPCVYVDDWVKKARMLHWRSRVTT